MELLATFVGIAVGEDVGIAVGEFVGMGVGSVVGNKDGKPRASRNKLVGSLVGASSSKKGCSGL